MPKQVGPYDPCSCGSGKKIEFCHGTVAEIHAEVLRKAPRLFEMKAELEEPLRLTTWPRMELEASGKKIRALGNKLITSPKDEPFERFLINVLFDVLGNDWYELELAKALPKRHVVVRWLEETVDGLQPKSRGIGRAVVGAIRSRIPQALQVPRHRKQAAYATPER